MSAVFTRNNGIARITIDRPTVLNAMDSQTYADIDAAFRDIETDDAVRVGIVTGAGDRAFSAGADLNEMHGSGSPYDGWGPWRPDSWAFGRLCSKPLIAAIDGYALAGGLELALSCDLRIATPEATFGAPEVKWALLHGLGAVRLPHTVGLTNAMWLMLTGDFIDAEEALRIGLINRIVPRDRLLAEAEAVAERIAEHDAQALAMTKEIATQAAFNGADAALRLYRAYYGLLEGSVGQVEGVRRFSERRDDQPTSAANGGLT